MGFGRLSKANDDDESRSPLNDPLLVDGEKRAVRRCAWRVRRSRAKVRCVMSGVKVEKVRLIPTFIAIYLVCWVLAYLIVNQDINLGLMMEYFVLAWTFDGFVRPFYTWAFSLLLLAPIAAVYRFILIRKERESLSHLSIERSGSLK